MTSNDTLLREKKQVLHAVVAGVSSAARVSGVSNEPSSTLETPGSGALGDAEAATTGALVEDEEEIPALSDSEADAYIFNSDEQAQR